MKGWRSWPGFVRGKSLSWTTTVYVVVSQCLTRSDTRDCFTSKFKAVRQCCVPKCGPVHEVDDDFEDLERNAITDFDRQWRQRYDSDSRATVAEQIDIRLSASNL